MACDSNTDAKIFGGSDDLLHVYFSAGGIGVPRIFNCHNCNKYRVASLYDSSNLYFNFHESEECTLRSSFFRYPISPTVLKSPDYVFVMFEDYQSISIRNGQYIELTDGDT